MAIRFLKIAVIYLAIGIIAGAAMGISHRFQYAPVHAHLNLLGWASLALAGLIYHLHPRAAQTRLAQFHFWLHNLGLPVFMLGMFLRIAGHEEAEAVIAIGAITVLIGVQMFVVNVMRNIPGPGSTSAFRPSARQAAESG